VTANQDRIDAARWRALRPLLSVECKMGMTWLRSRRIVAELNTVDEVVDKMVQIAKGQNDAGTH
jgi:hypothetical protein